MIGVALVIYFMRTETLMDIQTVVYPVVSADLLSLFVLGFMTARVDGRAALIATVGTVFLVAVWVFLTTEWGEESFPYLAGRLPNEFSVGVLPHLFLIVVGYFLSLLLPRQESR